jgi:hypothetical protein
MSIWISIDRKNGSPMLFSGGHFTEYQFHYFSQPVSWAKSTVTMVEVLIRGEIPLRLLPPVKQNEKTSNTLYNWALTNFETDNDYYRNFILKVIRNGRIIRKIILPNAYVQNYREEINYQKGVLEIVLVLRQKQDLTENITIHIQLTQGKTTSKNVSILSTVTNMYDSFGALAPTAEQWINMLSGKGWDGSE